LTHRDLSSELDADDRALVAAAEALMRAHYRPFWHTVASAMRDRRGTIWTGVHLGTTVGRLSICAEAIAMGRAMMEESGPIAVVSPCGACRELLADYAPGALVIVPGPDGPIKLPVAQLLPLPYQR